jgi:hypothetical protein
MRTYSQSLPERVAMRLPIPYLSAGSKSDACFEPATASFNLGTGNTMVEMSARFRAGKTQGKLVRFDASE